MTQILLAALLALSILLIVLQVLGLLRKPAADLSPLRQFMKSVEESYERAERTVREEIGVNRQEVSAALGQSRDELNNSVKRFSGALFQQLGTLIRSSEQKVDGRLARIQEEGAGSARQLREEVGATMRGMAEAQRNQIESLLARLDKLTESNEQKLDAVRLTVEEKLKGIQEDNARQLDQMRETVDEKLQGTLEKRIDSSFKQVSDRLEAVHKGLGEMQSLAIGVGDLKKVLTNVKSRGTWGEVMLGGLLEEVLSPEQYAANVATKDEQERVEFAIRLPGRGDSADDAVWLPIDAKFPKEDYERLVEAQEKADPEGADAAGRSLEKSVRGFAATICRKYLNPPKTTDFGIMFLPTEGLYAEVVRRVGLIEVIQRESRIVVAGPTTIAALLNSLQMGFRTLAIQKRSSEVWSVLGEIKTQFSLYAGVIGKLKKKLELASKSVEQVGVRTRAIQRKLTNVQALPGVDAPPAAPEENGVGAGGPDILVVTGHDVDEPAPRHHGAEQGKPPHP